MRGFFFTLGGNFFLPPTYFRILPVAVTDLSGTVMIYDIYRYMMIGWGGKVRFVRSGVIPPPKTTPLHAPDLDL